MPTESAFFLAALFVLMAAIGWTLRHFADRDRDEGPPARVSADYMRGLNLVLSRRTDEALELFVQMAKVDDETLETHFALGHLFRRRGEVDRAIRVHQNLLARPNLSEPQRHQALYSLGEDYLSAGLFDRAEKLFSELGESESHADQALRKLVYIYEQERDWHKAIETRRKLEVIGGERLPEVAHYYCELAEQARVDGNLQEARDFLKSTTRTETGAVRGSIIRADIARADEKYSEAIALYEEVIKSDGRFLSELLPSLYQCFIAASNPEGFERYIETLVRDNPALSRDLAFAAIVGEIGDSHALWRSVREFVMTNPILADLVDRDELQRLEDSELNVALQRIALGLQKIVVSSARFRCTNCGYSSQRLIWHCPSCKQWESVRPLQTFPFETLVS